MTWFLLKSLISGVIIATVSEIARRNSAFAALVASLPLVSVLGMIWIWGESHDSQRIAVHAEATFWYVLPSLPMFLLMPALIRAGFGFWWSLGAGCVLTIGLYALMVFLIQRPGFGA